MLSILITHFNRPKALQSCLKAINDLELNIPYEVVVSDDGSSADNLMMIQDFSIDHLLVSKNNKGLAANLNKGIKNCMGDYILYCQEDFLIKPSFKEILPECFEILDSKKLDFIRFQANYKFQKLIPITKNINRIPKFSFKNFMINTFQYSDNLFMTTPEFYKEHGYYLENTSGDYGETEYAIRILNSGAKIGISTTYYVQQNTSSSSVMRNPSVKKKKIGGKQLWRFARSLRQHLEWLLYSKSNRKLYTYKNKRKSK